MQQPPPSGALSPIQRQAWTAVSRRSGAHGALERGAADDALLPVGCAADGALHQPARAAGRSVTSATRAHSGRGL